MISHAVSYTHLLLRTVMMHPVFGISYFVRLGAFRDMPHFVRRDIFAFAKGILRQWRSRCV